MGSLSLKSRYFNATMRAMLVLTVALVGLNAATGAGQPEAMAAPQADSQVAPQAESRAESQAVIEAQLAAFRRDESAKAFSYATPEIQRAFQSPESFMSMVKKSYRVVYRHQQAKFLSFLGNEFYAEHTVQMVDENNALWTVYYRLEKIQDGSWRISSCETAKALGELI